MKLAVAVAVAVAVVAVAVAAIDIEKDVAPAAGAEKMVNSLTFADLDW